jgi:hypothetical protein
VLIHVFVFCHAQRFQERKEKTGSMALEDLMAELDGPSLPPVKTNGAAAAPKPAPAPAKVESEANYLDLLDEMMDMTPSKPAASSSALSPRAGSDKDYLDLINEMLSDSDISVAPKRSFSGFKFRAVISCATQLLTRLFVLLDRGQTKDHWTAAIGYRCCG